MTAQPCPRCGHGSYTPYEDRWEPGMPMMPALSRVDNETLICSDCGSEEALLDYQRVREGKEPIRDKGGWAEQGERG